LKEKKTMAAKAQDQEFLELIAKAIVGHPEDVVAERTVDERGVLLTLKINPEDMGYIIGRRGQTAQAVRTLLKIVGAKNNARVNLKIYEPEGSTHQRAPREGGYDNNRNGGYDNTRSAGFSNSREADFDTSAVDDLKI
jgi:hypothetical protein